MECLLPFPFSNYFQFLLQCLNLKTPYTVSHVSKNNNFTKVYVTKRMLNINSERSARKTDKFAFPMLKNFHTLYQRNATIKYLIFGTFESLSPCLRTGKPIFKKTNCHRRIDQQLILEVFVLRNPNRVYTGWFSSF